MWLIPPSPTLRFPQSGALRALPPDSFRRWVIVNLTSHCQPPPTRLLSSLKRQAKNAHTYTHTCTRARTRSVLPLARALPSRDSGTSTRVKSSPGTLPPASPRIPRAGRCRGRRQPSERASASLIPPQIQILKLGKTKAGEKTQEAGVMNEHPREGGHGHCSTHRLVHRPQGGTRGLPNLCSAHPSGQRMFDSSPSGAPLQRITRAPWAPSYDHRATRSPHPYAACL